MHIKATKLLAADIGTSLRFQIEDERPDLADITLQLPLSGWIELTRDHDGLGASGEIATAIKLECHRCLRTFDWPVSARLSGRFVQHPGEDAWPIASDGTLDIVPMVRQEILLAVPLQQLCQADCPGLCDQCGERLEPGHHHEG